MILMIIYIYFLHQDIHQQISKHFRKEINVIMIILKLAYQEIIISGTTWLLCKSSRSAMAVAFVPEA